MRCMSGSAGPPGSVRCNVAGQLLQGKLILTEQRLRWRLCLQPLPCHRLWPLLPGLRLQVAMARQMQLQEQRMKQAREREYNVAFDQYMDHERQQVKGS